MLKRTKIVVEGAKVFVIKKNQGKVSFLKVSGSNRVAVDPTNGNLTVKKNTGKGTYKIKVRVTAKGNANYEKGYKNVTVTVKVS